MVFFWQRVGPLVPVVTDAKDEIAGGEDTDHKEQEASCWNHITQHQTFITTLLLDSCLADCSQLTFNCSYMLDGTVQPVVNNYLPCWKGRVWKFAPGKSTPTSNSEVACAMGPNTNSNSHAARFSFATQTCMGADQKVQFIATPAAGYNCNKQLTVGLYAGKWALGSFITVASL
jgi:hypothetical protein